MSNAPLCYSFDPITGAYQGSVAADPSPEEDDVWLYPAHTTQVAPPEYAKQEIPVWDTGSKTWAVQPDHRGEQWWKAYGQPVTVQALGDPKDDGLSAEEPDAPPVPDLPATVVSSTQFMQQLALQGDITEDEAFAYLQNGTPPAIFEAAFNKITDAKQKFMARSKFIGADSFDIDNPYTQALIPLMGKDTAYAKELWQNASKL